MAAGAPAGAFVQVEFTPGVWTDVSGWVDWSAGVSTKYGRTTPYSSAQPATLNLTLDNTDGRFSPNRQLLADGTTTHPYWPNVVPRKRVRLGYTISSVDYYRFTGHIKGWPQSMKDAARPRVVIDAVDVSDRFSRIPMQPPIRTEILETAPIWYWSLTDSEGSKSAAEANGGAALTPKGALPAQITFGGDGPGVGDGTAAVFTATSAANQRYLSAPLTRAPLVGDLTAVLWFNPDPLPSWVTGGVDDNEYLIDFRPAGGLSGGLSVYFGYFSGAPEFIVSGSGSNITTAFTVDGGWHSVAVTRVFTTGELKVYLDGTLVGTTTASVDVLNAVAVGGPFEGSPVAQSPMLGRIGQLALYDRVLTASEATALYQAGRAWKDETVDQRIARYLGLAGLTSSDWNLDASSVMLSTYSQGGADIASGISDAVTSESGGGVFYIGADGDARFQNRDSRLPGAAVLTLDQAADTDGSSWFPAFDTDTLINQSTGSRATASDTASTQVAQDDASIAAYGLMADSFTSYAQDDADVLHNAEQRVASQSTPRFRVNQVAVDLFTAQTSRYVAVAGVEIGDRIRVTNLPVGAAPVSQVDLLVEGWADQVDNTQWRVTFDTSPADNPAPFIWEDAAYGRLGTDGQTLNTTVTASASTLVVATTAGKPLFTTSAGDYPMKITIGEERISLNSAPTGSGPQTFTGVTRGVDGTTAAPQTAGSTVELWPQDAFAL